MGNFIVEKINEHNVHAWKQKFHLVLSLHKLETLSITIRHKETLKITANGARMIAKLWIYQGCLSPTRTNVFEGHNLLNDLAACRRFYTAKMLETEKKLTYTNRVTSCGLHPSTTTHQFWMGSQNLENMRVFGSRFLYVLPKSKVKKLDPIALEAMNDQVFFCKQSIQAVGR